MTVSTESTVPAHRRSRHGIRRTRGLAGALAAAGLVATGLAGAASATTPGTNAAPAKPDVNGATVKVGMITTLSGGGAYIGEQTKNAFQLAFDLDGRYKLELTAEDDKQEPDTGQQLIGRMLDSDVDVVTGIIFSNIAAAVVPQVTGAGKIYLSNNAGPSPFAGAKCDKNYFVVSWQNDDPAEAMGKYLKDQGVGNVVALAPNYQAGKDSIAGFKRMFGEVSKEIYTEFGATDYAQAIAEIRDAAPKAVYFFYPGAMAIAFVKQYQAAGLNIPLYGPTFSLDENIINNIGDPAIGLQTSTFWTPDMQTPGNKEFVDAFTKAYGSTPNTYAAQAFDTANLLISALDANGGKADDVDALRAALEKANFQSVRGKFAFNTNHHPIQDWYISTVAKDDATGKLTNKIGDLIIADKPDSYVGECPLGK